MRRRITRAFFATAAAGATITTLGLAAASPAGAVAAGKHFVHFTPSAPETGTNANCTSGGITTGTWTSTDCGKAGYVATGRDFRYAQAVIKVPTGSSATSSSVSGPAMYVALDASAANNDFARVGIEPDPDGDGSWLAFYDIEEPGSPGVSATTQLSSAQAGDGVFVSAYFNATGNSVHVVASIPSAGTGLLNNTISVTGPVYTDAQALADWTQAADNFSPSPAVPTDGNIRATQFFQGRLTTQSGAQGTFKGPWTLTAVDATTNGSVEPTGTLIGQPSFLWNDGSSFGGMGNDAFGVWLYQNG